MAKNNVVKMKMGETIYPFEKFGSDLYASGDVRSLGFTAKRIAKYSPGVWQPFERAQQSVHLTAFGAGLLALLAASVVFLFKLLRKFGGK